MKKGAKKGLGKGLDALFSDNTLESDDNGSITTLKITQLESNKNQPRKDFNEEKLAELAESIRQHGLIQPIAVRDLGDGFYQIIAGERRWRAARMAGLEQVPVMITELDERGTMEAALIENLQREDLNPLEEASGYQTLLNEYHMTQQQLAERMGKSRSAIANSLRLLTLPQQVRDLIANGTLSAGHARALAGIEDAAQQCRLAEKIVELGLSVRQTEQLVKQAASASASQAAPQPRRDPNEIYYREIEKNIADVLGRKVHIKYGKKRGKIEIEYYSTDDLEKLLALFDRLG